MAAWAQDNYFPGGTELLDWEEDDNSVSNEVLSDLDSLDMNLIIQTDIEAYLEFLDTPFGQFQEGYEKFRSYIDSINYNNRKRLLSNHPFYSRCS